MGAPTPTARERFADALVASGISADDAWDADLVREIENGFLLLYRDHDEECWAVSRFLHYPAHPRNSDYDGMPVFEHADRDRAAAYFMSND